MASQQATSHPPAPRKGSPNLVFFAILGGIAFFALILTIYTPTPQAAATTTPTPPPAPVSVPDEIMKELSSESSFPPAYAPKEFVSVSVLVHHPPADTKAVTALALKLHRYYSQEGNRLCFLSLWDDERAFELWQYKKTAFASPNPTTMDAERVWKSRNWKKVCEHLVASVDAFSEEDPVWYYPFIDMQYREYGGRKTFGKK